MSQAGTILKALVQQHTNPFFVKVTGRALSQPTHFLGTVRPSFLPASEPVSVCQDDFFRDDVAPEMSDHQEHATGNSFLAVAFSFAMRSSQFSLHNLLGILLSLLFLLVT